MISQLLTSTRLTWAYLVPYSGIYACPSLSLCVPNAHQITHNFEFLHKASYSKNNRNTFAQTQKIKLKPKFKCSPSHNFVNNVTFAVFSQYHIGYSWGVSSYWISRHQMQDGSEINHLQTIWIHYWIVLPKLCICHLCRWRLIVIIGGIASTNSGANRCWKIQLQVKLWF